MLLCLFFAVVVVLIPFEFRFILFQTKTFSLK